MDDLVSTAWLAERLGEPGLVVIDASAHLPDAGLQPFRLDLGPRVYPKLTQRAFA